MWGDYNEEKISKNKSESFWKFSSHDYRWKYFVDVRKRKKHLHWDCYFSQVFVLLLNLILPTVVLFLIRMFLLTRSCSPVVVVVLLSTLQSAVSVQTTTPTGETHYSVQICSKCGSVVYHHIQYSLKSASPTLSSGTGSLNRKVLVNFAALWRLSQI